MLQEISAFNMQFLGLFMKNVKCEILLSLKRAIAMFPRRQMLNELTSLDMKCKEKDNPDNFHTGNAISTHP